VKGAGVLLRQDGKIALNEALATPAVVVAMPLRQAWRAATLGDKSAVSRLGRSVLAKQVIIATAAIGSTSTPAYGDDNV